MGDDFSIEVESGRDFTPFAVGDLAFSFSFSLAAAAAFDFEDCFGPAPIRLRSMFHFPFPGSSSGKSCESVEITATGRISGSGVGCVEADGFRW